MNANRSLWEKLWRPADAGWLTIFRVVFGLCGVYQARHFWRFEAGRFEEARFHFVFFDWVRPWVGEEVYVHLAIMGASSLCIAAGLCYRLACLVFSLSFGFFCLMEKSNYNNHYYLILLLSFLMIFVGAHRSFSLDRWIRPSAGRGFVPFWNYALLRAQIVVVYFFGGLAKLNSDWLHGEPMRGWLARQTDVPIVGPFLGTQPALWLFTYGGMLFDLSIGFMLLWRKTRPVAVPLLIAFHLTNHFLFHIGIFPILMTAATVLFFDPERFAGWRRRLSRSSAVPPEFFPRAWVAALLAIYMAFQIAIPLRHLAIPGNVDWTEEGHRFAWRMKLREKKAKLRMTLIDPSTGESFPIDLRSELYGKQIWMMKMTPDMILQYARHVAKLAEEEGIKNPVVRVENQVALNGRPHQPLIDPSANLASAEDPLLRPAAWILRGPTDQPPH